VSIQTYTSQSLPSDDNINAYCFCVDVDGEYFTQKGKMIAYYGQLKFEALTAGSVSSLIASAFSAPLYAHDFMVVTGHGKLILGDRGFDVNSYTLQDGNLTVRAPNLLGFDPGLALKQSIIPGFLTLLGTGRFLASSNGSVHFIEPPVRVDPQAVVGWSDCPVAMPSLRRRLHEGRHRGRAGVHGVGAVVGRGAPVRLHGGGDRPDAVLEDRARERRAGARDGVSARAARHTEPAAPAGSDPAVAGAAAPTR
jgi:hypothetical protein